MTTPGDPNQRAKNAVDPRRLAIVGDPENHAYVRGILVLRGVPEQKLEDRLNDVIEMSMRAKRMPLDDAAKGRLYMGGITRHIGIRDAHERAAEDGVEDIADHEERIAAAPDVAPEERDLARVVEDEGMKHYPRTFPWFKRNRAHGETLASIAASEKVSPGHVRREVALIGRTLPNLLKASGIVAMLLAVLFGGGWEWRRRTGFAESPATATRTEENRSWDASTLRVRAQAAYRAEAWQACVDDLDAAQAKDGGTEPASATQMRREALGQLYNRDQERFDAKPGR